LKWLNYLQLKLTILHFCNRFNFLPYTVELNYQATLLATRQEVGVVWFGPMMNFLIFSVLVFLTWICQKLFGIFPDIGSKLVVCYGLITFLDPLLILLVDVALGVCDHM